MDGFLRLVKPPGMTSHDVVQRVRRLLGLRAIGHTGTLDPAASGLLVLTVGRATRLGEYLLDGDKAYRAEITLGMTTTTADLEGEVTGETSAVGVTEPQVQAALTLLTGTLTMQPPAYSAVRLGGKRLYELARRGEKVSAPDRLVTVHEFRLLEFMPGERALARCVVTCSKGTYVRSLAEMLGEKLAVGGMLSALERTRVGPHHLENAITLEQLALDPKAYLIPPADGVPHLPRVILPGTQVDAFVHGNSAVVAIDQILPAGPLVIMDATGRMLGIGQASELPGRVQPRKVLMSVES